MLLFNTWDSIIDSNQFRIEASQFVDQRSSLNWFHQVSAFSDIYYNYISGLPPRYRDSVRQITPGLPLFLYNYSTHQLHGVFEVCNFVYFYTICITLLIKMDEFCVLVFVSSKLMHIPLQAASFGGSNIDPSAWEDKKNPGESRFPAQVRKLFPT